MFSDADAAALFDVLNPWDGSRFASDAFYDSLVWSAESVLDVGCGTGGMLGHARGAGHTGRLVGLDPDVAALDRARALFPEVEWVAGRAADVDWDREFEVATMVSHAFQCLVTDDELAASLLAIRTALRPGGRFAFETRHPRARAWEQWSPENATDVRYGDGPVLRVACAVEAVIGDVVTLTETTIDQDTGAALRIDRASLRFLDVPALNGFLVAVGFEVEGQYGDWQRGPVMDSSREIVTLARRPPAD
jgi:SAM-dependent methyltransferase